MRTIIKKYANACKMAWDNLTDLVYTLLEALLLHVLRDLGVQVDSHLKFHEHTTRRPTDF